MTSPRPDMTFMKLSCRLFKKRLSYSISELEKFDICCAFTKRISNYKFPAKSTPGIRNNILSAREMFFKSLNIIPGNAVFLEQPHKSKVLKATLADCGRGVFTPDECIKNYDAAITEYPQIALCVLTADCLPIIFVEPSKRIIGIAHAGWRGTDKKIVKKVVRKICVEFKVYPADMKIYIGPGIRSCCYKINADLQPKFMKFIEKRGKHLYLDLVKVNIHQLIESGIDAKNIFDTCLCTSCENRNFFSYRAGDKQKRILTMVMIRNK